MKVAVFGGTGFVGQYIVSELLFQGHQVNTLIRKGSKNKLKKSDNITHFVGNIKDLKLVENILTDCDVTIYLIGLIREFPSNGITFDDLHYRCAKKIIKLSEKIGIKRFILMSANGVKEIGTKYQSTKWHSEQVLKKTLMEWTIFRPSLIFGDPKGKKEFCSQIRDDMLELPLPAPLFYQGIIPKNAGSFKISPIHVEDVSKIFSMSISNRNMIGKIYNLGGPDYFSWKQIIIDISNSIGKSKWTMPIPVLPVKIISYLLGRFPWFPITHCQIIMLMEGNTCESSKLFEMLNLKPKTFSKKNLIYLNN